MNDESEIKGDSCVVYCAGPPSGSVAAQSAFHMLQNGYWDKGGAHSWHSDQTGKGVHLS